MKYIIKKRCIRNITTFYRNVSKKYKHTYSEEMMHKNADEAFDAMYQIEVTLLFINLGEELTDGSNHLGV